MQEQTKCVPSVQQNKAIESTVQLSTVQLPSKTSRFLVQFRELSRVRSTESSGFMERAMGIEPTSEAWEASILPLYDARSFPERADYTQRSGCTYRPAILATFHSLPENAAPDFFGWAFHGNACEARDTMLSQCHDANTRHLASLTSSSISAATRSFHRA